MRTSQPQTATSGKHTYMDIQVCCFGPGFAFSKTPVLLYSTVVPLRSHIPILMMAHAKSAGATTTIIRLVVVVE